MTLLSRQTVRLYTREPESVRLCVQPVPAGFTLAIFGPRAARTEIQFEQRENLERFLAQYEQDLIQKGFQMQPETERRAGLDRRVLLTRNSAERRAG